MKEAQMSDKSTVAGWTLGLVMVLAVGARAGEQGELPAAEGPFRPTMQSLAHYRCPQWFRDAKFGIWAHWGPQAVPMDGDGYAPCGQNTPLSIKTFGDGSLNAAECRDFGRGSDAEQLVVAGQSPVSQRVVGARAKIGRLAAMVELLSGVRGQAALR